MPGKGKERGEDGRDLSIGGEGEGEWWASAGTKGVIKSWMWWDRGWEKEWAINEKFC